MGGGSGYKPGSRFRHGAKQGFSHGVPQNSEAIDQELKETGEKIAAIENEDAAAEGKKEKAAEDKVIADADAANKKPAAAGFLMTETEINANWGFLKNIVNIDRFFDSGVKA